MHKQITLRRTLVALIVIALLGHTINEVVSSRHNRINRLTQQNSAQLYELNNSLAILPDPSIIVPGQTSGQIPGILNKYESLAARINKLTPAPVNNISKLLSPTFSGRYNAVGDEHVKMIDHIKTSALGRKDKLVALQKFLEYSPMNEFADQSISDEITISRIRETKTGIETTVRQLEKLQDTSTDTNSSTAVIAKLLADHYLQLQAGDFTAWAEATKQTQEVLIQQLSDEHKIFVDENSVLIRDTAATWLEI